MQSTQPTVVEDSVHTVVTLQLQFALAVVASMFGQCYPFIIVLATEAVVLALFAVSMHRDFCNVLSASRRPWRPAMPAAGFMEGEGHLSGVKDS